LSADNAERRCFQPSSRWAALWGWRLCIVTFSPGQPHGEVANRARNQLRVILREISTQAGHKKL
jgi:hypothetical protein